MLNRFCWPYLICDNNNQSNDRNFKYFRARCNKYFCLQYFWIKHREQGSQVLLRSEFGNVWRWKHGSSTKELTCHSRTPAWAPGCTCGWAQACTAAEGSWHTAPLLPGCKLLTAPQCTSRSALSCTPAVAQRGTASLAPCGTSAR